MQDLDCCNLVKSQGKTAYKVARVSSADESVMIERWFHCMSSHAMELSFEHDTLLSALFKWPTLQAVFPLGLDQVAAHAHGSSPSLAITSKVKAQCKHAHPAVPGTAGLPHTSSAAHWQCTACKGGATAETAAPQSRQLAAALQLKLCRSSAALA